MGNWGSGRGQNGHWKVGSGVESNLDSAVAIAAVGAVADEIGRGGGSGCG